MSNKNFNPSSIMDQLMASTPKAPTLNLNKGDQVKGEVIKVSPQEIIVDLGGKSEGVVLVRDQIVDTEDIKEGDNMNFFVVSPESTSGQVILSLSASTPSKNKRSMIPPQKLSRFRGALKSGSLIPGKVLEQNKGGFLVEVEGIRGFLPSSQISLESLGENKELVGSEISVRVLEIEEGGGRLVFTSRESVTEEKLNQLKTYPIGESVKGVVRGVFNFGLLVDLNGVEGLVKVSDVSWERVEDLTKLYSVGAEVEAKVMGIDEEVGRLNLSIKELSKDPFSDLSDNYQVDDVVTGVVEEILPTGVKIRLKDGLEGLIPTPNTDYTLGQSTNFLVSGVDQRKRVILLAPFITSTVGLIYR